MKGWAVVIGNYPNITVIRYAICAVLVALCRVSSASAVSFDLSDTPHPLRIDLGSLLDFLNHIICSRPSELKIACFCLSLLPPRRFVAVWKMPEIWSTRAEANDVARPRGLVVQAPNFLRSRDSLTSMRLGAFGSTHSSLHFPLSEASSPANLATGRIR
jgi:hypothetical protein